MDATTSGSLPQLKRAKYRPPSRRNRRMHIFSAARPFMNKNATIRSSFTLSRVTFCGSARSLIRQTHFTWSNFSIKQNLFLGQIIDGCFTSRRVPHFSCRRAFTHRNSRLPPRVIAAVLARHDTRHSRRFGNFPPSHHASPRVLRVARNDCKLARQKWEEKLDLLFFFFY